MYDVARKAGVSTKTVSRFINGEGGYSDATARRVQQAIDELGYWPSIPARNLVLGKSNAVGLVIPLSAHRIFSHLYFTEVFRGIAEVLSDNRLDLLVYLAQSNAAYVELYQQRRVDGLILMSVPIGDPGMEGLLESGAPCVFTCRITEHSNPTNWVDVDFFRGVTESVESLLHLGHERIALLAGPCNLVSCQIRVRAYTETLAKHGIEVQPERILHGEFSFDAGRDAAHAFMAQDPPPTALICGDDMMALGAVQGLRQLQVQVPDDVSVIGFDDIILAEYATPPLTTVHQDAYQKGRIAAGMLLQVMSGSRGDGPLQISLDTELVIRDSTGPATPMLD